MLTMKTLLNCVERHKGFVYENVRLLKSGNNKRIEVIVQPRKNSKSICSKCGKPASGYDVLAPRRFQYVPLWGIAVVLIYAMRRVECPDCGVKVEKVPWAHGKSPLAKSFSWFLCVWARRLAWDEVAVIFGTTWNRVYSAVKWAVAYGLEHRDLCGIKALGIDEIAYKKGHKYLTVVYEIEQGMRRLLWIGKDRTEETLKSFFDWFGKERSDFLRYICTDMWGPYLKVVRDKAKKAINILDRFHVMSNMNKKLDEVRRWESKVLREQGIEILKGSRWCFLKRPSKLTSKQCEKLKDLLGINLRTIKAYLMKEDFQRFWGYIYPANAAKFLDQWCKRAMYSRIEPMKEMARSLRSHQALLLNWFKAKKQYSSGVVEGLNNKLKTTTKKSYGFRTYNVLEVQLYHTLGELPLPETTHKFC
jgi:transposase